MTEPSVVVHSTFTEVWHCNQPEAYRVRNEQWDFSTEPPTRHVYAVEEIVRQA